ncbi:hypothetical protein Neosp_010081 [[Neocosmospora] mangrovei]
MAPQKNLVVRATTARDAASDGANDTDAKSQAVKTRLDVTNDAHPSGREASPRSQSSSPLETLPPELRFRILYILPDLQTLRSLVHASPIFHAQYRQSRDRMLRAVMGREFDGFLVDAYATLMSRPQEFGSKMTDPHLYNFSDPFRLRFMSAFHLSVAQPLAHRYCEWALANLQPTILAAVAEDTGGTTTEALGLDDLKLQRNEMIRVLRAIYRYETYYNLFGYNEDNCFRPQFTGDRINNVYFSHFEPWEVEAVGCIHVFIHEKCQEIVKRLKDDLYPRDVKFRLVDGVYRYEDAFRLTSEVNDYMRSIITRGLRIPTQLLGIDNDEELVPKLLEAVIRGKGSKDATIEGTLTTDAQWSRRYNLELPPTDRDEAAADRDPMEFTGDGEPPSGPPLGWVRLWRGIYSNIYGEYTPETVQRWGYVMWNKERWLGSDWVVWRQWRHAQDRAREIELHYNWRPGQRNEDENLTMEDELMSLFE